MTLPEDPPAWLDEFPQFDDAPAPKRTVIQVPPLLVHDFEWLTDALREQLRRVPGLFVHGTELVRVSGPPGERVATPVGVSALRNLLSGRVEVQYREEGTGKAKGTFAWVERSLHRDRVTELVDLRDWTGVRPLRRISHHPTLAPSGELLLSGYDARTETIVDLHPDWTDWVPPEPLTQGEAQRAADDLLDEVGEFGLSAAGRSAFLAAVLTIVARHLFDGPSPMFVFDAPVRASGKSLLAELAMRFAGIWTNDIPVGRLADHKRDDERAKAVLSILRRALPAYLFDNVQGPVGSETLDALLTSSSYTDRLLGSNDAATFLNLVCWMLSANNADYSSGDTIRRVIPIYLEHNTNKPEDRQSFRRTDIKAWTKAHRLPIYATVLSLLRAFWAAGAPDSGRRMASFEDWARVVGSCVQWLDLPHPLDARGILAGRDDTTAAVDVLLDEIVRWRGHGEFFANELEAARHNNLGLADALVEVIVMMNAGKDINTVSIGKALKRLTKRRDALGRHIVGRSGRANKTLWAVQAPPAVQPVGGG